MDLNKIPFIYWSDSTKISYLQRRIIIYSIMYYENNGSCISDKEYDKLSYQLVDLQRKANEEDFKQSMYYYAMYDFDGSTGFDIPSRLSKKDLSYLSNMASHIYHAWSNEQTKTKGGSK